MPVRPIVNDPAPAIAPVTNAVPPTVEAIVNTDRNSCNPGGDPGDGLYDIDDDGNCVPSAHGQFPSLAACEECAGATVTLNDTLADGLVGTVYAGQITASGGSGVYTYAVTEGAMPTGLAMNGAGAISGTPTTAGVYEFTVTAADANGCPGASRVYVIAVAVACAECPGLTPRRLACLFSLDGNFDWDTSPPPGDHSYGTGTIAGTFMATQDAGDPCLYSTGVIGTVSDNAVVGGVLLGPDNVWNITLRVRRVSGHWQWIITFDGGALGTFDIVGLVTWSGDTSQATANCQTGAAFAGHTNGYGGPIYISTLTVTPA